MAHKSSERHRERLIMKWFSQALFAAALLVPSTHATGEVDATIQEYLDWAKEQAKAEEEKAIESAIYNQWKKHAKSFVENNNKAHFELTKDLSANVEYSNVNAGKDDCSDTEVEGVDTKLAAVFEGILAANGLDFNLVIGEPLSEEERRLQFCHPNVPYYLRQWCRRRRRRHLQDDTGAEETDSTLYLRDISPEGLESFKNELETDMKSQCESILKFVAHTSGDLQHSCHVTLAAAQCNIVIDIFDAIKLVEDGVETESAAQFIETTAQQWQEGGRRNLRTGLSQ